MLILIQPSKGNSHTTGKEQTTLPLRILIQKKLNHFIILH